MPTPVFTNNAEGYSSSGTNVTAGSGGNSGGGSGDYWDVVNLAGGTIQAVTAAKMFGTYGYRLTRSGSSQIHLQKTFASDISDFVGQHWDRIPTQPSANHVMFKGYSDAAFTTTSWAVAISTTGKLIILAGPSSTTVFTGTDTIPANTYCRFEYEMVSATSVRVVVYSLGSNTILADSGTINTALVGVTRTYRRGLLTTASSPASLDADQTTLGIGPGLFGLATSARPTILVSNPGAYVAVGAASLVAALGDVEADESSPASYIESPAGPANAEVTFGFSQILPAGGLTVEVWCRQSPTASPGATAVIEALIEGSVVGSSPTVALTTAWTKVTFTIASASGDMSTLQARVRGNQP